MRFMHHHPVRTAILGGLICVCFNASAESMTDRELAAKKVSAQFLQQLGGELKKEISANGPVAAISVCRDIAPKIANDLSIEHGWKVTRVSKKARNPMLGTPDAWENKKLDEFEIRAANGAKPGELHTDQIVREGDKSYYRCMTPIAMQPICLTCHGSDTDIPAEVKAKLDQLYPHDQARGYQVGDIRGAVSIKQPLNIDLPDAE